MSSLEDQAIPGIPHPLAPTSAAYRRRSAHNRCCRALVRYVLR